MSEDATHTLEDLVTSVRIELGSELKLEKADHILNVTAKDKITFENLLLEYNKEDNTFKNFHKVKFNRGMEVLRLACLNVVKWPGPQGPVSSETSDEEKAEPGLFDA